MNVNDKRKGKERATRTTGSHTFKLPLTNLTNIHKVKGVGPPQTPLATKHKGGLDA
jgi:hypothetical protein